MTFDRHLTDTNLIKYDPNGIGLNLGLEDVDFSVSENSVPDSFRSAPPDDDQLLARGSPGHVQQMSR